MRSAALAVALLLLPACEVADASLAPTSATPAPDPAVAPSTDVVQLHAHIDRWSAAQREQARLAVVTLLTNCPYNRSVIQVPIVLEHAARTADLSGLSPSVAGEWRTLAAHLAHHVAVVDAIAGPELVQPGIVDDNFGLQPGSTPTRAALLADPDPLARTAMLQDQIDDRVLHMPAQTHADITTATDTLRALTGDGWPPTYLLEPTLYRLKALAPELQGTPLEARADAMLQLIEKNRDQGC